jgi:hypothetical protein
MFKLKKGCLKQSRSKKMKLQTKSELVAVQVKNEINPILASLFNIFWKFIDLGSYFTNLPRPSPI